MVNTETEISVNITLSGDCFDLEYVTNTLGINPTYKRNNTEILGNGKVFGYTEWGIGTGYEKSLDIEVQFLKIYSLLKYKEIVLANLAIDCNAEWHIVFVIKIENGDVPAMVIPKEMIEFCYKIGAEIGFDTYVLSARE